MRKIFYLSLILVVLEVFKSTVAHSATPCNCTHAPHQQNAFKQAVLSRRTRSFVFPKKAFLLLTPAFTKAVLDGRPRGLSYSVEFDMYSPLPDTPEGWKPTILFNSIKMDQERERLRALKEAELLKTQPTPPPAATALEVAGANGAVGATPVAASPSLQDSADYAPLPFGVDTNPFGDPLDLPDVDSERYEYPLNRQDYFDGLKRYDAPVQSRYNDEFQGRDSLRNYYSRKFKKTQQNISSTNQYETYRQFHKMPSLKQSNKSKYNKNSMNSHIHKNNLQDKYGFYDKWSSYGPTEKVYHKPEAVPAWKYHQDYRERREIFDQLEAVGKIFNINMKACIQRAMCEITQHLRPYGSSLMEDIVRIILTIPTDLNFDDDYSGVSHKLRNVNCVRHFALTCPYPVLDLLTKNLTNINVANAKENKI